MKFWLQDHDTKNCFAFVRLGSQPDPSIIEDGANFDKTDIALAPLTPFIRRDGNRQGIAPCLPTILHGIKWCAVIIIDEAIANSELGL